MKLDKARQLLAGMSPEQARRMTREQLLFIVNGMTADEVQQFLFEKNIKLYGGINNYIDDFFGKGTVETILGMPEGSTKEDTKTGLREILRKMLQYPDVTEENKARIMTTLSGVLAPAAAPAAGGRRRRRMTRRGKSRQRRRRV